MLRLALLKVLMRSAPGKVGVEALREEALGGGRAGTGMLQVLKQVGSLRSRIPDWKRSPA